jgi:hypothetical protein
MVSLGTRSSEGGSIGARILALGSVKISCFGDAIASDTRERLGRGRTMLSEPSGSHRSVVEGLKLVVAHPVITNTTVPEKRRWIPRPDEKVLQIFVSVARIVILIP